jgi:hypothetical protein
MNGHEIDYTGNLDGHIENLEEYSGGFYSSLP